jgi:hypothetical protein
MAQGEEPGTAGEPVDDVAEALDRQFRNAALQIARRLRATAEDIERRATEDVRRNMRDLLPDYLSVAERVSHDVQSMMGNLSLDYLILRAAEADRFVRASAAASAPGFCIDCDDCRRTTMSNGGGLVDDPMPCPAHAPQVAEQ